MGAVINFDATNVKPDDGSPEPVPSGWYNVMMTASEMKPTSGGDGERLACVFTILDGQFQGRKLFEGFNLKNANAQAVEISYKQLSAVCHAIGVLRVADTSALHDKPLKVRVKVKPAQGQYDAGNSIVAYKNINEPTTAAAAPVGASPFGAPTSPPGTWTPPVHQQPWGGQQAPQQAPQQPQWAPPVQQQAPQQAPQQPQWAPPAAAPAGPPAGWAPQAPVPAGPPPGWAAPQAPQAAQQPAAAPAAAPAWAAPGAPAVQPPWMTQPPQA